MTKSSLAILFILSLCPLQAGELIECLQYRIERDTADGPIQEKGKWQLHEDKGVIVDASPILLNQDKPGPATLYEGLVIRYEKRDGVLRLEITSNVLEGFIELEPGKYSPAMTPDWKALEIPRIDRKWVDVKLKGRKDTLQIRCVEFSDLRLLTPDNPPEE